MAKRKPLIAVTGDVCVDWISIPVPGERLDKTGEIPDLPNWRINDGTKSISRKGGALLLQDFVSEAIKHIQADSRPDVLGLHVQGINRIPPAHIVHSMFAVDEFKLKPNSDKKDKRVWRVTRFDGAHGPAPAATAALYEKSTPDKMSSADIVVIDDAGNGFREASACWPPGLKEGATTPWIVLKMSQPLAAGNLWGRLITHHADRLIAVVDADDIRKQGIQISEGISWERTAIDTVGHLMTNPVLTELCKSAHVIVRFGCEGALHYFSTNDGKRNAELHFAPEQIEGTTATTYPGKMTGLAASFTAAIVKHLADGGIDGIREHGIQEGIRRAQTLFRIGFTFTKSAEVNYPCKRLFEDSLETAPSIARTEIGYDALDSNRGTSMWSIAANQLGSQTHVGARDVVVRGKTELLDRAPVGVFGGLQTVDRGEIESYRTIRNLIAEYDRDPNPKRPLCIAVFGPPGAGKSFGVKQVAKSMDGTSISSDGVEFNISQFDSPDDLVRALNRVRDSVLEDRLPLVFFDEFDSPYGTEPLGWIKYFLMPMQDGEFRDGEIVHPIGKCIFVFAGGVFDSLEAFGEGRLRGEDDHDATDGDAKTRLDAQDLKNAKVPDFISRLRGFVNVTGPNSFHPSADRLFHIRRALLLRSLLKKKRPKLFHAQTDVLDMDPYLIDALIHVPAYKHGARSVEAIVDMSSTAGRRRFNQSALPPAGQLELHVDSKILLELLQLGPKLEEMAEEAHEEYRRSGQANEYTDVDWEVLDDDFKESNRRQVLDIPVKLQQIGIGLVRSAEATNFAGFEDSEVEFLAPIEHMRWYHERLLAGWRYADIEEKDVARKLHPLLIPWDKLSEEKKELDRIAVRHIPNLLAIGGLKLVRLNPPVD